MATGIHRSSCYCTVNGERKSATMIRDYCGGYYAAAAARSHLCYPIYNNRCLREKANPSSCSSLLPPPDERPCHLSQLMRSYRPSFTRSRIVLYLYKIEDLLPDDLFRA